MLKSFAKFVGLFCCSALLGSAARADATAAGSTGLPAKGQSMSVVTARFGEPERRYPAVGGESPKHPPITRWDYPGFSVFFEHTHVINAVIPGRPPELQTTEGLDRGQ